MTASRLVVVVPDGIDDPRRPSGGNRYDRRLIDAMRTLGVEVTETAVTGSWPRPDDRARGALRDALGAVPIGTPTLVDGLAACGAADVVIGAAERISMAALVHMPFGPVEPDLADGERAMLSRLPAVVTTSEWTGAWLTASYGVPAERITVATPGADRAAATAPEPDGTRWLCVAAVTRAKGHDVLLGALAALASDPELAESGWRCTCVGSLEVEPDFAASMHRAVRERGLADRVRFTGPLGDAALAAEYADADLVLLPSRSETWGLVVTESLARAVPVLASKVGGVPESLGRTSSGRRPGMLVPAGDPGALADALRRWLSDATLRARLRRGAAERRGELPSWKQTAARLVQALAIAHRAQPRDGRPRTVGVQAGAGVAAPGTGVVAAGREGHSC